MFRFFYRMQRLGAQRDLLLKMLCWFTGRYYGVFRIIVALRVGAPALALYFESTGLWHWTVLIGSFIAL